MVSVSLAMATFNGARYIRRQLDSLAAQTHLPSELVVTDDGSTDETLKLVEDFAASAPFPVLVQRNETRLGYRANFFRAAMLCNSDLIAFCDQDDIWDPRKIEICARLFDDPDVLLAYHNATIVTSDGSPTELLNDWVLAQVKNPPMSIRPWPFVKGFTQIFRRSVPFSPDLWAISLDYMNTSERMAHDQWFFFIASVLGTIAYVNEPLAYYRQHDANIVGVAGRVQFIDSVRFLFYNNASEYARFRDCAMACGNVLDNAKETWNGTWRVRASVAAAKYRRLSQQYADRTILYTAADASRRLRAFRNILNTGGYGRYDNFAFGVKSLAKDAFLGVLMGRKLRRCL